MRLDFSSNYPLLILPGVERLPLATYGQIETYARNGAIVIATRNFPSHAPGMRQTETDTPKVRELSEVLFRSPAAKGFFVSDEKLLSKTLAQHLKPDVTTSPQSPAIGFVHRKLPSADIYFLANTSNQPISTTATFRASEPHAEWGLQPTDSVQSLTGQQ